MTQASPSSPALSGLPDVQRLPGILARYRDPNPAWSLAEIAMTVAPLVGLWAAMWGLLHISYWLCLALALPAAGFLVRVFHDPARLRPRRLLPHPRDQRLGRPCVRRADDDALRLLEADARRPSCLLGQSRPSRHRRHRHVDGARIPGSRLAKSAALPAVSASDRHVRTGPHLYVPVATPRSGRPDARRRDGRRGPRPCRPTRASPPSPAC